MKTVLKWLGILLGAVVVIILIFAGFIYLKSNSIRNTDFSHVKGQQLYVPDDSLTIARGKHVANTMAGCVDCHGKDYGGFTIFDAMPFARLSGANLTRGEGGIWNGYTIADFDRAVRHGVRKDGKGIWIMPSFHYCYLSDDDVAAVYAYISSLPPVNRKLNGLELGPIGRMVLSTGGLPRAAAEYVNHDKRPPARPEPAPTREYGEYIARVACVGCHAPNFSGGPVFGGDPKWPPAANITMGGKLRSYKSVEDLKTLLRSGERPDGTDIDPAMPITSLADLSDDEVTALWEFLTSLPAAKDSSASWWTHKAP